MFPDYTINLNILSHLKNDEIYNSSLVNKQWNTNLIFAKTQEINAYLKHYFSNYLDKPNGFQFLAVEPLKKLIHKTLKIYNKLASEFANDPETLYKVDNIFRYLVPLPLPSKSSYKELSHTMDMDISPDTFPQSQSSWGINENYESSMALTIYKEDSTLYPKGSFIYDIDWIVFKNSDALALSKQHSILKSIIDKPLNKSFFDDLKKYLTAINTSRVEQELIITNLLKGLFNFERYDCVYDNLLTLATGNSTNLFYDILANNNLSQLDQFLCQAPPIWWKTDLLHTLRRFYQTRWNEFLKSIYAHLNQNSDAQALEDLNASNTKEFSFDTDQYFNSKADLFDDCLLGCQNYEQIVSIIKAKLNMVTNNLVKYPHYLEYIDKQCSQFIYLGEKSEQSLFDPLEKWFRECSKKGVIVDFNKVNSYLTLTYLSNKIINENVCQLLTKFPVEEAIYKPIYQKLFFNLFTSDKYELIISFLKQNKPAITKMFFDDLINTTYHLKVKEFLIGSPHVQYRVYGFMKLIEFYVLCHQYHLAIDLLQHSSGAFKAHIIKKELHEDGSKTVTTKGLDKVENAEENTRIVLARHFLIAMHKIPNFKLYEAIQSLELIIKSFPAMLIDNFDPHSILRILNRLSSMFGKHKLFSALEDTHHLSKFIPKVCE